MFNTEKELIDNLYYKGYNPKLILCDLKQNRAIRTCYRNDNISSPKCGICIINFDLEDRWLINKGSYNLFDQKALQYRNYIVGFLFINYVKKTI